VGRRQVEFVALELHDFRCFGGVQRFEFEPPTSDGRSGITVITGSGASGGSAGDRGAERDPGGLTGRGRCPDWLRIALTRCSSPDTLERLLAQGARRGPPSAA
jgi:hypothetical protein